MWIKWLKCFTTILCYFTAVLVSGLLLVTPSVSRRKYYLLPFVVAVIICVVLCAVRSWLFILYPYNKYLSVAWFFLSIILSSATIFATFRISFNSLLWVTLASVAVERLIFVAVFELLFLFVFHSVLYWIQLAVFAAVCAPIYFIFFKIFKSDIKYLNNIYSDNPHKGNILLLFMLVLYLTIILLIREGDIYGGTSLTAEIPLTLTITDMAISLFILMALVVALSTARNGFQKSVWVELFKENKKQYEAFRNTVDYINIKCHDLKHEIEYLRGGGTPDPEKLKELAKNVAIYEAFAKTGNETLDILLTEKNLLCLSESITLTYMADAAGLEVMAGSDIYSLFGNLLDNAIEYLRTVKDGGERFIRLFIKPQGGRLIIHEENYYIGKGTFKGGIPQTTKPDKIRHGFGIRSMTRIAKQYGGDLLISTEEGLFKVDIYIKLGR